jgi:hypothetical protein
MSALVAHEVSAAVVDINLGLGPSFRTAQALHARSIPFVFLTDTTSR